MKKPIKNFSNYLIDNKGDVWNITTKLKRKLYKDSGGRLMIDLWEKGIRYKFLVHRLVAQAFIYNPNNKPQINHINGTCIDNRVENLEWVTDSENKYHAHRTGLITPKRIKVIQLSKNEEFIKQHISILHASKDTKVDRKSIKFNILGKYKQAGGFVWKLSN